MEARNTNPDEIDLLDLFLKFVLIIKNNALTILLFFIVGTVIGTLYYYSSKKVYENGLLIRSTILADASSKVIFENLNNFLKEDNKAEASKLLNLTPEEAANISSIKIDDKELRESMPQNPKEKPAVLFLIKARTYNQDFLPRLEKGIIYFIENNPYVKIRIEQNKKNLTELVKKSEEEIKSLESLKERFYEGSFFREKKDGSILFDPTEINSKIIELTEKKHEYQNELDLVQSVQVIQPFIALQNPVSPNLALTISAGAFFGMVMVGIFIAFKSVRKLVRMAEANQSAA
ncbi:hypothetical protein [Chryseosolibacter indicus]|uniref:Polysaccharide chain length determinant N-terminal domain-containing protein n=1 Tax=Chryseosolibacter indicus TaxID=2782351 RepID=A0ABS5VV13_9BACT|nr:hypothetical protein [Chryseosolibacter indicus]MBT1704584.1 hypothetical protein [Chryseosolibacter indicus]